MLGHRQGWHPFDWSHTSGESAEEVYKKDPTRETIERLTRGMCRLARALPGMFEAKPSLLDTLPTMDVLEYVEEIRAYYRSKCVSVRIGLVREQGRDMADVLSELLPTNDSAVGATLGVDARLVRGIIQTVYVTPEEDHRCKNPKVYMFTLTLPASLRPRVTAAIIARNRKILPVSRKNRYLTTTGELTQTTVGLYTIPADLVCYFIGKDGENVQRFKHKTKRRTGVESLDLWLVTNTNDVECPIAFSMPTTPSPEVFAALQEYVEESRQKFESHAN